MRRMQLQLREDQLAGLQSRAAVSGRSIAALVRDALDVWLATDARQIERALATIGTYRSGLGDLAEKHDRYLDAALES